MKRLVLACVGNSLRSQMAEGLARALARPGTVEVRSGGTQPSGFVHPKAIRAMREVGIDITHHASKPIDVEFALASDAFVTLCGPIDDACPAILASKAIRWPQPDPSAGSDDDVRRVREAIRERLISLYKEWGVLGEEAVGRP